MSNAPSPKARHTLMSIGCVGDQRVYFDVSRDEAVARYQRSEGQVPTAAEINEIVFVDEFGAYDIFGDNSKTAASLPDTPLQPPPRTPPGPPIPMRLPCPSCGNLHVDEGEFATEPHHTHACQQCGMVWRPALVNTVGVRFLPGFVNDAAPTVEPPQETQVRSGKYVLEESFAEKVEHLENRLELDDYIIKRLRAMQAPPWVPTVAKLLEAQAQPGEHAIDVIERLVHERELHREEIKALRKRTEHATDAARREALGRLVREVWVEWACEQPDPEPSRLVPWEDLSEPDREGARRIGERLAQDGALRASGALTAAETMVAVALLEMAASDFAQHSCNDFDLKPHLPEIADRQRFVREVREWNGDPENYDDGEAAQGWVTDWFIMRFLAAKLREVLR